MNRTTRSNPAPSTGSPALIWPLLVLVTQEALDGTALQKPLRQEPVSRKFQSELQLRLLSLSVRAYERLIAELLRVSGYEDVGIMRNHQIRRRSHKGRNRHGGVDIVARSRTDLNTATLIVQVKQYQRPISRRFVDELRGALLRTRAHQACLISTSTFAPTARRAALENHVGPVHLIDGAGLRDLLMQHRLGVRQAPSGYWALDRRFFRRLEKQPVKK